MRGEVEGREVMWGRGVESTARDLEGELIGSSNLGQQLNDSLFVSNEFNTSDLRI